MQCIKTSSNHIVQGHHKRLLHTGPMYKVTIQSYHLRLQYIGYQLKSGINTRPDNLNEGKVDVL